MKTKIVLFSLLVLLLVSLSGCAESTDTATNQEAQQVEAQQQQYLIAQPVPQFDWSLERYLVGELYKIRNRKVATYSVWRSDYGLIEGDCPSSGYGIPYDVSMTNPLQATDVSKEGRRHSYEGGALTSIGQAEPNGIFASTNTSATWVFCVDETGDLMPVYVESHVTVYPYAVEVNYETNRVIRAGNPDVTIKPKGQE